MHVDVRRVGGHAVVYKVGDGCLRAVPKGPQGLDERARLWFNNLEAMWEYIGHYITYGARAEEIMVGKREPTLGKTLPNHVHAA
jgi:hypothetical protein